MKRANARRYENYLYGSRGYRRLLHRAGFRDPQVFIAMDSYNQPEFIVPIDGTPARYFFRTMERPPERLHRRVVRSIAEHVGILGHLQYAFILLAGKP